MKRVVVLTLVSLTFVSSVAFAAGVINTGQRFRSFPAAQKFMEACERQRGYIDCQQGADGYVFCWCGEHAPDQDAADPILH